MSLINTSLFPSKEIKRYTQSSYTQKFQGEETIQERQKERMSVAKIRNANSDGDEKKRIILLRPLIKNLTCEYLVLFWPLEGIRINDKLKRKCSQRKNYVKT